MFCRGGQKITYIITLGTLQPHSQHTPPLLIHTYASSHIQHPHTLTHSLTSLYTPSQSTYTHLHTQHLYMSSHSTHTPYTHTTVPHTQSIYLQNVIPCFYPSSVCCSSCEYQKMSERDSNFDCNQTNIQLNMFL